MAPVRRLMLDAKIAQAATSSAPDDTTHAKAVQAMEQMMEKLLPLQPYKDPAKNDQFRTLTRECLADLKAIRETKRNRGTAKKVHLACVKCHQVFDVP